MMDERKKAELETMEIIEAIRNGKNPNILLVAAQSYADKAIRNKGNI